MIRANGHDWNNFFCRRVYTCPGLEGSGYYSFEMENSGRGKHLFGPAESQWLHYRLSSKDDRAVGGKSFGGESERPPGSVTPNGIIFKGGFFWLRQAGKDQPE